MTSNPEHIPSTAVPPPPTLEVADSKFIGYTKWINSKFDAISFQTSLKNKFPSAAHVAVCWAFLPKKKKNILGSIISSSQGYDEDGEPPKSVGPVMVEKLQEYLKEKHSDEGDDDNNGNSGLALVIVRYFGCKLLGVTCGRLSQCYETISSLTLHRAINGNDQPLHIDYGNNSNKDKYGLGAGDCELITDILSTIDTTASSKSNLQPQDWVQFITNELEFDGFRGNKNEELPRLQNLQADVSGGTIPIYRYPGNYRGDEWTTFQWTPSCLLVKAAVEDILRKHVICSNGDDGNNTDGKEKEILNHCVSNYYRNGDDFIDHHSDKDLDLDRNGVIISVSLGDERVLELKRRQEPRDTTQIVLPHGSMLILGPKTNKTFTHSILKKEGTNAPRLSLTFRSVTTFMDLQTERLFGHEGASLSSLAEVRHAEQAGDCAFLVGFGAVVAGSMMKLWKPERKVDIKILSLGTAAFALSFLTFRRVRGFVDRKKEEKGARRFFSKTSVNGTKYL